MLTIRSFTAHALILVATVPFIGGSGWVNRVMAATNPMTTPVVTWSAHSVAYGMYSQSEDPPEYFEIQDGVHEALFGTPFDVDHPGYILNDVAALGELTGTNGSDDPFVLDVILVVPITTGALAAEGLTQQQIDDLNAIGIEFVSVAATMSTSLGSVAVTGLAWSGFDDNNQFQSRFVVMTQEDAEGPLFSPPPLPAIMIPRVVMEQEAILDILDQELVVEVSDVHETVDLGNTGGCQHCYDAHNDAVAAANDVHQQAVAAAQANYAAALAAAQAAFAAANAACAATFTACVNGAVASLAIQLALCAVALAASIALCALVGGASWWTFGVALAICLALAAAAAAICVALAIAGYNAAIAACNAAFAACTAAAAAAFIMAVLAAQAALAAALAAAENALAAALAAAQAALEACLATCGRNTSNLSTRQIDHVENVLLQMPR